jgi:uncharacterized protein YkwD
LRAKSIRVAAMLFFCVVCSALAQARPFSIFSRDPYGVPESEFRSYKGLNDQEARLREFKDSDETLRIKIAQLHAVNESRKRHRLQELELDILASRVANKMAAESATEGYFGHYNLRGEKPYHRYAFAGGVDHVTENASMSEIEGGVFDTSAKEALRLMQEAHQNMYNERPPADGHRKNILDPNHNLVGLGLYLDEHRFRYYEEYIDSYLEFLDYPKGDIRPGQTFTVAFRPLERDRYPYAVMVYYEPFPRHMSARQINRTNSYPDYTDAKVFDLWPYDLGALEKPDRVEVPLRFDKEGLYYVNIYLSDSEETGECRQRGGCSYSTVGKIQASGLVIQVQGR